LIGIAIPIVQSSEALAFALTEMALSRTEVIGSLSNAAKHRTLERKSQIFSDNNEQLPSDFSSLILLVQPHFNKLFGFDKLPLGTSVQKSRAAHALQTSKNKKRDQ
jgi:hypothetical protein